MIVKKWLPYPMWDFAGIEHWLNEQAQNGYLLNGWPGWSFIGRVPFRTDPEAKGTRYRLDPGVDLFGEEELRRRISSYRDAGWRYEGKVGKFYAIYSCDDPQAPDLYNDASSMALAMRKQTGRAWLTLFVLFLWLGAAFWDEWVMLFTRPASLLTLIILRSDALIPLYLLMTAAALSVVITDIGMFAGIYRTRAILRRGEWPAPGRRNYLELRHLILVAGMILLAAVIFIYLLCFKASDSRQLSGPEEWAFPHITLEEVIPAGAELHLYNDQEMLHHDELSWSSLAPEQYDVAQAGAVRADGPERDARVNQEHVRTLSPTLAELVYRGKLEDQRRSFNAWEQAYEEETISSGLDALTCFTYQYSDERAAHRVYIGLTGDRVFVLDCSGAADSDAALALLLERLRAD